MGGWGGNIRMGLTLPWTASRRYISLHMQHCPRVLRAELAFPGIPGFVYLSKVVFQNLLFLNAVTDLGALET